MQLKKGLIFSVCTVLLLNIGAGGFAAQAFAATQSTDNSESSMALISSDETVEQDTPEAETNHPGVATVPSTDTVKEDELNELDAVVEEIHSNAESRATAQILPDNPKWLDSTNHLIPKENAFLMMETTQTRVADMSAGIKNLNRKGVQDGVTLADSVAYPTNQGTQWVRFENVGYYNGHSVGVKVSITPQKSSGRDQLGYSYLGTGGSNFLRFSVDKNAGSAEVKFEFLDEDGTTPIRLSGYWTMANLNNAKSVTIPDNLVDSIYSVGTQYQEGNQQRPIKVYYTNENGMLTLSGTDNYQPIQRMATITYTDTSYFMFRATPLNTSTGANIQYVSETGAKVAIPDPQGIEQKVTAITQENKDKLDYRFVQHIPYESAANRTQKLVWQIEDSVDLTIFDQIWQVVDETGTDRTSLFQFNDADHTIQPKSLQDSNLYNHYFTFKRKLVFNGREVDETLLAERDNGQYLMAKGEVALKVDQLAPASDVFQTDINLAATIDYHYLIEETNQEIQAATSEKGVITKRYPLVKAPNISGYSGTQVNPEDLATAKLIFSQEQVTFYYVETPINATAVPQSVVLGTDLTAYSEAQLKSWVTDVTLEGQPLTEYQVALAEVAPTDRITGDDPAEATLKLTTKIADRAVEKFVAVPVNVTWGNSIALGGSGTVVTSPEGQSTLALTLHEDASGNPYLTSAYGNLPVGSETIPLSSSNATNPYYQVTVLDMSDQASGLANAREIYDGLDSESDVDLQAMGSDTPADLLSKWGDNGRRAVHYGDIIKLYVEDGPAKAVYQDGNGPNQPLEGLPDDKTIFGVITKNGFVPLYLDHLDPDTVGINCQDTYSEAAYDQFYTEIGTMFSIPEGVSASHYAAVVPDGYKRYPQLELAVGAHSIGDVWVAEPTTTSGEQAQYVKFAYPIDFVGSGPNLQINVNNDALSFKPAPIVSYTQEIQRQDANWGLTVLDNRQDKANWMIQARMDQPFTTGTHGSIKELKGAQLQLKQADQTISLNQEYQPIYMQQQPKTSTAISWDEEEGFFLRVPPGNIENGETYQTEIEFVLMNVPTSMDD